MPCSDLPAHSRVQPSIDPFIAFNVAQVPQWCFRWSVRGAIQLVQILRSDPTEENSCLRHIGHLAGSRALGHVTWWMDEVIHEVGQAAG